MERFSTLMGCAVVVAVALFLSPRSHAVEPTWTNYPDIKFSMLEELGAGEERPKTIAGTGNRDCIMREVLVKPGMKLVPPPLNGEVKQTMCGQDTSYGFLSNVLLRSGTSIGGPFIRGTSGLLVGPNLHSGVIMNSQNNIYVVPGMNGALDTKKLASGEVEHRLSDATTVITAKTAHGYPVVVDYDSISFSSNGKWMLADVPWYGLARINLETGEVLSFGLPTTYGNGTNPGYQTAISSDGRYAVVASGFYQIFRIYDLSTCSKQQWSYPNLKDCQSRNLQDKYLKDVNYGVSPTQIRFEGKAELTFYTSTNTNGLRKWRQYRMTMGNVPRFGYGYLGLGDSFASGEGAGQYKPVTDQKNNMCHTSMVSYPFLTGVQLGFERYHSIACSGAVVEDIYQFEPKDYEGQAKDGLRQEQRDIEELVESFLPGKVTQYTFLERLKPESVTISIGGNDIAFGDKIKDCVISVLPDSTCFNTYEERLEAAKEIEQQISRLEQTYRSLVQGGRRVYVLGYPKLIDPDGNCASNVHLDNSEADFANKLVTLLNDGIEVAAKRAGVQYVDVENMLDGHRFCETDSKNVYVHGLTGGDETGPGPLKFLSKASFHPKAEAQPLYRNALMEQTDNLGKPMPKPDTNAKFNFPPSGDAYWQAEKNGRSTFITRSVQSIPDIVQGQPTDIKVGDLEGWLKPNTDVTVELHSSPFNLGKFRVDTSGNLLARITVPTSVKPGWHSVHIYGQNVAGEPVDLYQYLYILAGANDADGDGLLNENDPCTFIDPIGEDVDRDNIDDGCDAIISDPPLNTPPNPNPIGLPADIPPELLEDQKLELRESVAGNEPIIPQPAEEILQASTNVAGIIDTDLARRVLRVVAGEPDAVSSEVLSATIVTSPADSQSNLITPASIAHGPVPHPKATNSWWITAVAALLILVSATFAYARLRIR